MPDIKLEPGSDWIDIGRPKSEKNLVKALTMDLVLIFLRGMASGNRVQAQMIVNRYWLAVLILGRGPTQSMIILLNGSSKAGIG